MPDTKTSALTSYTTPQAGDLIPIVDIATATIKQMSYQNFRGGTTSASVAAQSATFATDIYVAGSSIPIPVPTATSTYWCSFDIVKTAAGIATPIFTLRMGTLGTAADAAVIALTFAAQTAAVDTGILEFWVTFRTVGAATAAVVSAKARLTHHLAATGLTSTGASGTGIILGTSAGFNSTTASSIMGLSANGGTSAAWTVTNAQSVFRF